MSPQSRSLPCFLPRSLRRALALLAALLAAAPVPAGEGPLGRLELAARLHAEGVAQADPLLLLAAARLRHGLRLGPAGPAEAPPDRLPDWLPDWSDLLDAAAAAAAGDAALLALIEAVRADLAAEGARGVATGQLYSIARLEAGGSDTYPALPFAAGEYAEVYVEAEGAVPLSLHVFDSAGAPVCADTDPSPVAYCGWRPVEADRFTVRVDNPGAAATGYALMTN